MEDSFTSLNDFIIISEIYRSAWSTLYKCQHKISKKIYTLKVYKKNALNEEQKIDLLREKTILTEISQKNYPNIIKFYGSFEDNDSYYSVIEYLQGQNLEQFKKDKKGINNNNNIEEPIIINILKQILKILIFLHNECHVMHRDIMPINFIIDEDYNIKLIELILSVYLQNENPTLVSRKSLKGPVKYAPPEILLSPPPRNYDYKIDIFELGCTIFYLMNGHLPYNTKRENGNFIREESPSNNNYYSKWLVDFVKLLYENNLSKRPTALEALNILDNLIMKQQNQLQNNNNININNMDNNNLNLNNINNNTNNIIINNNSNNELKFDINEGNHIIIKNNLLSSLKALLQCFVKMEQFSSSINLVKSANKDKLNFIPCFSHILDIINNKNNNQNINIDNYNKDITIFLNKVYCYYNGPNKGLKPLDLYLMILEILENECIMCSNDNKSLSFENYKNINFKKKSYYRLFFFPIYRIY